MTPTIITTKADIEKASAPPCIDLPSPDRIPELLLACPQWVYWISDWNSTQKRWTKVLYFNESDRWAAKAKSTDPKTWTSFWNVWWPAFKNRENGARWRPGVGFVLTEGITVIDIDDCRNRDTGELTAEAIALIRLFNSYTEVSPSGTGVKIFLRGSKPGSRCFLRDGCPYGHIEFYECERFVVVTGNVLKGVPRTIESRQAELDQLYHEVFPPKPVRVPTTHEHCSCPDHMHHDHQPTGLDDQALFEVARRARDGDKFERLWHGDWSDYRNDRSVADFALAGKLAFYCGPDAGRIESLMRQSGLVRDKWDSPRQGTTYLRLTIERAIAGTPTFYTGRRCYHDIDEEIAGLDNLTMVLGVRGGDGASETTATVKEAGGIKRVVCGHDLSDLDSDSEKPDPNWEEYKARRRAMEEASNAAYQSKIEHDREQRRREHCDHVSQMVQRQGWRLGRLLPIRCHRCQGCINLKKRLRRKSLTDHILAEPADSVFCTFTIPNYQRKKDYERLRCFDGHYAAVRLREGSDTVVIGCLPAAGKRLPKEARLLSRDEALKLIQDTIEASDGKGCKVKKKKKKKDGQEYEYDGYDGKFCFTGKAWELPKELRTKSNWENVGSLNKALSEESIKAIAKAHSVTVEIQSVPEKYHKRMSGALVYFKATVGRSWGRLEFEDFVFELGLEEVLPSDEAAKSLTRNMRDRQPAEETAEEFVLEV